MAGEWRELRLGEIADILPGKFIRSEEYDLNGQYVIFGSNSIMGRSRFPLYDGPIIAFARIGSNCGATIYSSDDCWINNNAAGIKGRNGCNTRFLFYWLRNFDFTKIREGSGQPFISNRSLNTLVVNLPPLSEQRAIAHILGTLDDKIELNRRMNETLEAMARALFKAWFVDFDPVRAKAEGRDPGLPAHLAALFPDRLVETDDGELPDGWDRKPLPAIADFLNGLALQKFPAANPSDSLPVIKIAELRNGISATSDRASRDVPAKYVVRNGDFLFSWSGSLLAKFWTGGEGALNQHLFKVTSERYPPWFFAEWVQVHLEEFQRIAASKATTMGHIQRSHLQAAMTNCPPDAVVKALGAIFEPLIKRQIEAELQSHTLGALRDALLPKLISGELRVRDAERFLERVT